VDMAGEAEVKGAAAETDKQLRLGIILEITLEADDVEMVPAYKLRLAWSMMGSGLISSGEPGIIPLLRRGMSPQDPCRA
jgi:hypothetical protein